MLGDCLCIDCLAIVCPSIAWWSLSDCLCLNCLIVAKQLFVFQLPRGRLEINFLVIILRLPWDHVSIVHLSNVLLVVRNTCFNCFSFNNPLVAPDICLWSDHFVNLIMFLVLFFFLGTYLCLTCGEGVDLLFQEFG